MHEEWQASPCHLLRTCARVRIVSPPGGKLLANHGAHPSSCHVSLRRGWEVSNRCSSPTTYVLRTCIRLIDTSRVIQLRALKMPAEAWPFVTYLQLLSDGRPWLCLCETRTVTDYHCLSNFYVMYARINNLISSNSQWSNPYIPG